MSGHQRTSSHSSAGPPSWPMRARLVVGQNTLDPEIVATFADGSSYDDRELICHAPDDLHWLLERYTELATRYRRLFEQDQRSRPNARQWRLDLDETIRAAGDLRIILSRISESPSQDQLALIGKIA